MVPFTEIRDLGVGSLGKELKRTHDESSFRTPSIYWVDGSRAEEKVLRIGM